MIDTKKGLIAWFARNSVAANLLMLIIILAGVMTVGGIKKQMFPELQFKTISIQVPYLGAAPQEVDSAIVDKIEEVLEDVDGLEKVTSVSNEGMASVTLEVDSGYDVQEVLDEVKMRVDSISTFPEQAEKPTVFRNRLQSNVIWLSIHGDLKEAGLKELAKDIRDELKQVSGITKVTMVGARDYELAIEVAEHRLKEFGLTFDQVVNAVRNSSIDLPGGSIKSDYGDILLRTKGQAYQASEFADLVLLTNPDGTRLLLSDIAEIRDGFEETESFGIFDGKNAISLRVDAVGDDNALAISDAVKQYVEKKKKSLPVSVTLDHWGDASYYLKGRLELMTDNMLLGAILVLIVLALFLELKVAFWVMVGIPVCFLGALALMPIELFDVSINMISLFAFILVLGIVVDDAIVMGESAYTQIEKDGHSVDSVVRGVKKVAIPATFGVLTTIAAFLPMLMVSGFMGAVFKAIAVVVMLCLMFSLIESKLILPAHLARMKVKQREVRASGKLPMTLRIRDAVNGGLNRFVQNKYKPFISKTVKYPYITASVFVAGLIITGALIQSGVVRFVFFPNIPSDFIQANLTMVEGSSAVSTNRALAQMEQAIVRVDEEYFKEHGERVVAHRIAFNTGSTSGQMFVELSKGEQREIDGLEIVRLWREQMPEIAGLKNTQFNATTAGGGGADMAFQLEGKSLDQLSQVAKALKAELRNYEGVSDVRDSFSGGNEEIVLKIKPEAQVLGLTLSDVARQVRYGFYGAEAQRMQRGGEEVKVMVRYPKHERHSIGNLENMRIRTPSGEEVPFQSVAEFELQPSYATITRVNGERSITISAAVDKAVAEPGKVVGDINGKFLPGLLEKYPGVETALEGASKDQQEAMVDLAKAAVFALFTIYALMAIPLRSYGQPLIIMSVIPFGLIGAVMGHLILGLSISILSLFGIIALAGVVVNDSLIMVDFVNRARSEGMSTTQAAVEAGTQRFRAIVLTSLTTFMGLTPIVLERSLQAQFVMPMAVSLAFGILFATVITLVLIPSLYVILDDLVRYVARYKQALRVLFRRAPEDTIRDI